MNVVKLTDRRDARRRHFQKREARRGIDFFGTEPVRSGVHLVAPGPEAVGGVTRAMLRAPADNALEGVRVRVDEAR